MKQNKIYQIEYTETFYQKATSKEQALSRATNKGKVPKHPISVKVIETNIQLFESDLDALLKEHAIGFAAYMTDLLVSGEKWDEAKSDQEFYTEWSDNQ